VALAQRILDCMKKHRWESRPDSPAGPTHLPAPLGPLFEISEPLAA